ncbi:MAG: GNAT family N-acetyltransferase [Planctomycetales bacterium]|nr:GNAT family N-acetyltransferase [Planctomycetales bacterium]
MATVLYLSKPVTARPHASPGRLRNYRPDVGDETAWLQLRSRAIEASGLIPRNSRAWTERDFQREFLNQPWWLPARMWFTLSSTSDEPTGSVALMIRHARTDSATGHLHWLIVDPDHQRQGIGRILLHAAIERCVLEGLTELNVETLSSWRSAVSFYRQHGFKPRAPS